MMNAIATIEAALESYRRESLNRLTSTHAADGSAADVLDLAYAMRWLELEPEATDPLVPVNSGTAE